MAVSLIDGYDNSNATNGYLLYKNNYEQLGHSFKTANQNTILEYVDFYIQRVGSPPGLIQALVYAHTGTFGTNSKPTGAPLAVSDGIPASFISGSLTNVTFGFSGADRINLAAMTEYVIALRYDDPGSNSSNYIIGTFDATLPTAPGNMSYLATGGPWQSIGGYDMTYAVYADVLPGIVPTSISSAESVSSPAVNPGSVAVTSTSVVSEEAFGGPVLSVFTTAGDIPSAEAVPSATVTQSAPPPPPTSDWTALGKDDEKTYIYKVYQPNGAFVGVIPDVTDQPEFTETINTAATVMTIQLGRSPNNKIEQRVSLLAENGDFLTTEAGDRLVAAFETPYNVGPGTEVVENYNVDVYVVYGEYSRLLTQANDLLTTETGEALLATSGAPMGKRIFSGFILDYETEYGADNGVTVTVMSHGYELAHDPVKNGANTTVSYASAELASTLKAVLDTNPGKITYNSATIANTGVSAAMKFVVNTKKEAAASIYEQTPDGWYWYVNVADNLFYLLPKSSTPHHVFTLGKEIKTLKVKKTIESLVNDVYFIGGETTPGTPSSTLYRRYTSGASLTAYPRRGLKRVTDRRYTVAANAQRRADKDFGRFKDPIFSSPLVISSARYDIETIQLGHTIGFAGFGNFIDDVVLQVVRRKYVPTEVTLDLGDLLEKTTDLIADVQDQLENEQFIDLPNAPS